MSTMLHSDENLGQGGVKQEQEPLPQEDQLLIPPLSQPQPHVKSEPVDLQPIIAFQQQKEEPQFFKSIEELGNLSAAINAFVTKFYDLKNHLDFIKHAIDARSNGLDSSLRQQQHQQQQQTVPQPIGTASTTATIVTEKQTEAQIAKSEIVILCETMCSKDLRRYLIANLSNISKLRQEVPSALKCSPRPAKLVLDCVGRFFLQGSKAYTKRSPMVSLREACVLVLEMFLLMIEEELVVQMEAGIKQEAEQAAVGWRKRLLAEGGLGSAVEIDAKGLLLLVACYGIPNVFKNEDVWNLVRVSNSRQISEALRRSRALVARVSDIIKGMMKNGMKVEAVDVACTFGIEDKFPPQELLTSFLHQSKEALKRRRREAKNSPSLLKEANEKQLAALKSVMKFLEDRKLDPTKLLSGWQLKETIVKLEKDNADLNKKIHDIVLSKRKAEENEISNKLKSQEAKRLRFTASPGIGLHEQRKIIHTASPGIGLQEQRKIIHTASPGIGLQEQRKIIHTASPGIGLQEQRKIIHTDSGSRINVLDGGYSGHINHYPTTTSVLYGTGGGSLPENVLGSSAGSGGAMHTAGVGLATAYGGPSTSSLAGVKGEMLVDRARHSIGSNGLPHRRHEIGDAALSDRSLNQSFARHALSGMFGPSPSIEGFAGLLNSPPTGAAIRNSASDLYRFADAVVEVEYSGSRRTVPLPSVVGPHQSSYM